MRKLETEIVINAIPEVIWSILTDFEKYPNWNPFIISLEGNIEEGNTFTVTMKQPNSKAMSFKPKCTKFEKNKGFRWLGHLIIPGLFDGEHIFELIQNEGGSTKFVQRENFKGILVPLLWKNINTKTRLGFELMNQKLKELSENSNKS